MAIPIGVSAGPIPAQTRLTYPATDDRLVYRNQGNNLPLLSQAGTVVTVYTDSVGTQLADIQNLGGQSIVGSQLTVDNNSQIPQFLGPAGVEVLYVKAGTNGSIVPIFAWLQGRYNDFVSSLTQLQVRATALESADTLDNAAVAALQTAATGNAAVRNRGAWAAVTGYLTNDIVTYNGSSYIANQNFTSTSTFDATKFNELGVGPTSANSTYDPSGSYARDNNESASRGGADRLRSAARHRAAYEDNLTAFIEQWANLTAWTVGGAGGVQVSGGRLYGGATPGGATSGLVHAFPVSAAQQMRALFNVQMLAGETGGGILVGTSNGVAGAAPASGASEARGLYFNNGSIYKWDGGITTLLGGYRTDISYTVAVIADDGYFLGIIATANDGSSPEFRARFTRNLPVNNLYAFNSGTRGLAGSSVGNVAAHLSTATLSPRATAGEGSARTVHWSQSAAGSNYKVTLPPIYDSRIPTPLAVCFHGNGSDEHLYSDNIDVNATRVGKALTDAGYIVLTAAYTPGTSSWGAQGSLDAYYAAYLFARDHYAIGPVVMHADSMGGIESLLCLADRRIPGVVAWAGSSPTANLAAIYSGEGANFTSVIAAAYGIDATHPYATQTAGHDPAKMDGRAFRGLPMRFYAATDDTTVLKVNNTDVLAAKVAPYAKEANVVAVTGGHGSAAAFPEADIVAFFNKYVTGP